MRMHRLAVPQMISGAGNEEYSTGHFIGSAVLERLEAAASLVGEPIGASSFLTLLDELSKFSATCFVVALYSRMKSKSFESREQI